MEKKFRVNPVTIILLISYFLSSILTYIFAENNLGIMTQEVRVIVDILIVISIIQILEENSEKFFMDISNAFIIGCVVTCISGIFYPINQNIKLEGYRLEAINSDPNYFSLCMAFSISLLLLKIYNNGTKKTDLVIMLILTLSGLMSLSRGYIISMIINVLFFVYLYLFSFKISVLKRIAIIGFLILLIIVMNDYLSNLYSNLLNRTFSEETKGGSGRIDIWSFYLNKTFSTIKNVFFGLGTPNEKLFNSDSFSVQHNIYLELLSGKGVIGTVIVISIYVHVYKIIKKYIKTIKNNIIAFIPLTTLGIGFMFLNGIVSDIGIMTIFLGFLSLKINSMKL
jgi:O-antigen ligase